MIRRPLKRAARLIGVDRARFAAGRMACERNMLAVAGPRRSREGGRILCYHSVGQPFCGVNDVAPQRFRRHIELALESGFRFVPAAEIAAGNGRARDLAITFDDGWLSVRTAAAPVLREHAIPWSLFIVSGWLDRPARHLEAEVMTWRDVEALAADGVDIGSHSVSHPNFGWIGPDQAAQELEDSRWAIGARLGFAPTSFAIPLGQSANWTPEAMRAARRAGYSTVYAQAEETRPPETVARTFVTQFDNDRIFKALLDGAYDSWEEWV